MFKVNRVICVLCIALICVAPSFADEFSIVYKGKDGVGKGKHIVFIAADHEYRGEQTLPALARIMAKLNLFFGVPRINTEFIPSGLIHLTTYFRQGPITFAFPVAITILTAVLAVCAERLMNAQSDVTVVGFGLLTALTALALLEHWLMVVPLPDAKLWRWLLPSSPAIPEEESKTHGF